MRSPIDPVPPSHPSHPCRRASQDEGEAVKIKAVKEAEAEAARTEIQAKADAEAKFLAGQGIARQRQAIMEGLRESVNAFKSEVQDVDAKTVMDLMIVTQYFDMMRDGAPSPAQTAPPPATVHARAAAAPSPVARAAASHVDAPRGAQSAPTARPTRSSSTTPRARSRTWPRPCRRASWPRRLTRAACSAERCVTRGTATVG